VCNFPTRGKQVPSWKCGAARDLSIHESESWDGDAAKSRIFNWAGFDGDSPDTSKARKAFLIYDSEDPEKKGSYKLPFTDIVDGELMADSSGINAASSRLRQTDAPDDVLDDAEAVLDHYKNEMDGGEDRSSREIFAYSVRAVNKTILSLDELTERMLSRAMNEEAFKANPPFVWGVKASSSEIDTYFTRMAPSTLKNFAEDAENGVSFQNSHRYMELPFGRSLAGKFTGGSGHGLARMEADFFTVRGGNFNGVATDQLILGMETGIIKDVSVGFYGGSFRCSICGKDPFDWWIDWENACPHIPGVEYDVKDKDGKVIDRQIATAWVENAHLAEVSAVFDGANPGAAIRKAELMCRAGALQPEIADLMNKRYRTKFSGTGRRWAGSSVSKRRERMPIDDNDLLQIAKDAKEEEKEVLAEAGVTTEAETAAADGDALAATPEGTAAVETEAAVASTPEGASERSVDLLEVRDSKLSVVGTDFPTQLGNFLREAGVNPGSNPEETVRLMAKEIRSLRLKAEDGEKYRNDLIAETITAGIKTYGNDFDSKTYQDLLRSAPIDAIKRMKEDFNLRSAGSIPIGRKTEDGVEAPVLRSVDTESPPDSVYLNA
jgi:hypothetical protein